MQLTESHPPDELGAKTRFALLELDVAEVLESVAPTLIFADEPKLKEDVVPALTLCVSVPLGPSIVSTAGDGSDGTI